VSSVSDGNAAHVSSASMMEMTNAIEQVFPQASNFAALKYNAQAMCYSYYSFGNEINVFVLQTVVISPKAADADLMLKFMVKEWWTIEPGCLTPVVKSMKPPAFPP
jgi:hypothetical protein